MAQITVPMTADEKDALLRLAESERRDPRDQAAKILSDELARRGLLPNPVIKATDVSHGGDNGYA